MTAVIQWHWRTSTTARLGLLVVAFSLLLTWQSSAFIAPSWLDVSSKATISILILAPGLSALTAWDARRFRAIKAWRHSARPAHHTMIAALAPATAWAITSLALGVLLMGWRARLSEPGWPHFGVLSVGFLVCITAALGGHTLGRYLPSVYAVPLAFAASWLWLVYPPTITPYWVRNITGNFGTSCCSLDQALAPGGTWAPIVTLSAIAASLTMTHITRVGWAVTAVAILLPSAVFIGRGMTQDFGPDPVTGRVTTMACRGEAPQICSWPENRDLLAAQEPRLREAVSVMRQSGVPSPAKLTEAATTTPDHWTFTLTDSVQESVFSVAESPIRDFPPACVNDTRGRWPAGNSYPVIRAWLSHASGADTGALEADDPELDGRLSSLLRLSVEQQTTWYNNTIDTMGSCTASAPPIPTR
ncbi:MAG: DUF7224 domain-containing protein [Actinomycetota bacterium]